MIYLTPSLFQSESQAIAPSKIRLQSEKIAPVSAILIYIEVINEKNISKFAPSFLQSHSIASSSILRLAGLLLVLQALHFYYHIKPWTTFPRVGVRMRERMSEERIRKNLSRATSKAVNLCENFTPQKTQTQRLKEIMLT